jgi:hypothetical protein
MDNSIGNEESYRGYEVEIGLKYKPGETLTIARHLQLTQLKDSQICVYFTYNGRYFRAISSLLINGMPSGYLLSVAFMMVCIGVLERIDAYA